MIRISILRLKRRLCTRRIRLCLATNDKNLNSEIETVDTYVERQADVLLPMIRISILRLKQTTFDNPPFKPGTLPMIRISILRLKLVVRDPIGKPALDLPMIRISILRLKHSECGPMQ